MICPKQKTKSSWRTTPSRTSGPIRACPWGTCCGRPGKCCGTSTDHSTPTSQSYSTPTNTSGPTDQIPLLAMQLRNIKKTPLVQLTKGSFKATCTEHLVHLTRYFPNAIERACVYKNIIYLLWWDNIVTKKKFFWIFLAMRVGNIALFQSVKWNVHKSTR